MSAALAPCPTPSVYERPAWRSSADGLLRPGGLRLTDRAMAIAGLPIASRIWDIGCGLGVTVDHLIRRYGLAAVGVDSSEELLRVARGRMPWLPLVQARGDALPCPTGALDGVLAECSWSAMAGAADAGPDRVLAEFRRVLRPRGWLIISDLYARGAGRESAAAGGSAGPGAWEGAGASASPFGDASWRTLPTEPEIIAAIAAAGFEIERWEDHSLELREYAARMILEHGSLEPLWGPGCCGPVARAALVAARPGYFLLVARRD